MSEYERCPLPVVRERWREDETGNDVEFVEYVLGVCGAQMFVSEGGAGAIWDRGYEGPDVSHWSVECESGHTLLLCDAEDRSVPVDAKLAMAAIERVRASGSPEPESERQ